VVSATRQAKRGATRASRKVQDSSETVARTGAGAREQAEDVAEGASAQGQGLFEETAGGEKESSGQAQTFRQELAGIVREAAIEVLAPVARQATKYAAKYAVQRGPKLAQETLMPRLKETLGSVQDAGGPGAFARDALGSGGGVLSRFGGGDDGEEDAPGAWESAKAAVEEHVDVAIGIEDAYDFFQQFGQRVRFMSDHEQVEDVPNERIVWESTNGVEAICVITFHELADRLTRVMVTYEANPHGLQKATSALRQPRRAIRGDLMRFKSLVEVHPDEADDLYDESDEQDGRDEAPELDEEAGRDEQEDEEEVDEEEADEEEADEPAQPTARRRSQSSGSRRQHDGGPPREESSRKASAQSGKASAQSGKTSAQPRKASAQSGKASAQPRKRTVRSGSGQAGSGSGGRRQSQPASKARASSTRAKAKG
jgi:hypothetical protein